MQSLYRHQPRNFYTAPNKINERSDFIIIVDIIRVCFNGGGSGSCGAILVVIVLQIPN